MLSSCIGLNLHPSQLKMEEKEEVGDKDNEKQKGRVDTEDWKKKERKKEMEKKGNERWKQ